MMAENTTPTTRDSILALDASRLEMEEEIQALIDDLQSPGVNSPLCDEEGFPRADIDVSSTRHKRHRLICLRNDLTQLMSIMERGLHQVRQNR
jgi:26S proteasome non-ATPase regulatory subunit 9